MDPQHNITQGTPTRETTGSIRQILMNELGLTRESIREMAREIVVSTVEKYFASGAVESLLESHIATHIRGVYTRPGAVGENSALAMLVKKEVANQVKEAVVARLEALEITLPLELALPKPQDSGVGQP